MKKLNRIILLIVVLSILFTMTANAASFNDIADHWAKTYIERVEKNNLVSGYSDGSFKPDDNVTVLESLVMMSRLYAIDEDIKKEIIDEYKPSLRKMPNVLYNEWALDYLAISIELGIVSEQAVRDMFAKKTIFEEAKREEVAVFLTHAMGLKKEADSLRSYVLPFKDSNEIDSRVRQYIYILYDKEIMMGDKEKNINPKGKITRAEISTLLDKAYSYIERNDIFPDLDKYEPTTTVSGVITEVSTGRGESYLYVKNERETTTIVKINNSTEITLNGRSREFSDLKEDMIVSCKINEDRLALEIEADSSKEVVRGTIYFVAYASPAKITIHDEDNDRVTYSVDSSVDVYHDGKATELRNLKRADQVTLLLDSDKVYQINSISRIKHFDGLITSIDYNYPIKVTMKTEDDVSKTFTFNSDVEVTRNDKNSSFDQVRVGDEVTITTEYDEMIAINTVAKEAEMSGVIREILIAPQSKIKIADEKGNVSQYSVSNNVIINVGDKNVSIYDLRIGYNVDVNTSGDEIVTMEVSQIETAKSFSGKIIFINEKDRLIMMQNLTADGKTELIHLQITNNTKIFDTSGSTKYFKDLEEGESILSFAVPQGGEYVAASIMIQ
ncbi:MAG: S-layer homology domain-containing protein [Tissierellia bacterium]|nr:S-layer homology domain-containing protein [Tissierellia bacterium]